MKDHLPRPERDTRRVTAPESDAVQPSDLNATHAHLLHLQRTIGNRAIQRLGLQPTPTRQSTSIPMLRRVAALTVQNIDWLKSGAVHETVNVATLLTHVGTKITTKAHRDKVIAVLNGNAAINAPDLPQMAQQVVAATTIGANDRAAVEAQLVEALKLTVQSGLDPNEPAEASFFDYLLVAATTTSVGKGTPNTIALADFGENKGATKPTAGMRTAAAIAKQVMTEVRAFNNNLAAVLDADLLTKFNTGGDFTSMLYSCFSTKINAARKDMLRDIHGNKAGWLGATIDVDGDNTTFMDDGETHADQTLQNNPATANMTFDQLSPKVQNKARISYLRTLNATEQRRIIWSSYPISTGNTSTYIELNTTGSGMTAVRLVYDFAHDVFYFTLHYNWHKGYNPFFQLV